MSDMIQTLQDRATLIGFDSIRATTAAGSGHPTSCLSIAEIMSVLYFQVMQYDPTNPHDENNDRCILSKGHATPALYAVFKQRGVISDQELLNFRTYDSVLEGHPTPRWSYHEAATGSLGQGLAVGVGMALAHRMKKRTAYTYIILGDGESAEGSVWEAASLASWYSLNRLIAIVDINRLGQTGATAYEHNVQTFQKRFEAFGWKTIEVDGHDIQGLLDAFDQAKKENQKPTVLLAKTYKGHGFYGIEDSVTMHGKPFTKKEVETFDVEQNAQKLQHLVMSPVKTNDAVVRMESQKGEFLDSDEYKKAVVSEKESTRKAAGLALKVLGEQNLEVVALDADVRNSTYLSYFFDAFADRSFQAFVAEQAMVSMASGFALRGQIPFAATFAAFFTRSADQLRMAGIGKTAIRLIGSHAGISIGQDGPSQMGLEDLGLFRAIPDSLVLYPADAHSTFACIGLMAEYHQGVSYLRATRAETKHLYSSDKTFVIGGSHLVVDHEKADALIIAAGITVHEAVKAAQNLEAKDKKVIVLDAYSIKPLDVTTIRAALSRAGNRLIIVEDHYQAGGLGEAVCTALAGIAMRFEHLSVKTYARSASPEDLMRQMGIDAQNIEEAVDRLSK